MKVIKEDRDVLVELTDDGLARKTVKIPRHSGFRKVSAEEMVDREVRALQQLEDIDSIQRFVRRESSNTFYTEYIPSNHLLTPGIKVGHDYFDQLATLVHECQRKGVYRVGTNRRDFLVLDNQRPAIIDFGNILFDDDPNSGLLVPAAKIYSYFRLKDLRKRYVGKTPA